MCGVIIDEPFTCCLILLYRCILTDYVFEEETLDQIIGLLTHFGLMHRTELDGLKFEQQPLMLVPWYFRADPPSHVMKEDISDKVISFAE